MLLNTNSIHSGLFEEFKKCKEFKLVSRNSKNPSNPKDSRFSKILNNPTGSNLMIMINKGSTTLKNNLKISKIALDTFC